MFDPVELENTKILIAGPTSQVAKPLVEYLASRCKLHALARFSDDTARQELEAMSVTTHKLDLADGALLGLDDDFDYVINMAVVKSGDFEYDLRANAEGVGRLLYHSRKAKAFLHISSTAVYQYNNGNPVEEKSALGDHHRNMFPTYSMAKIAAESVVRFTARQFSVPTTIARLSVPYGDNGGWPYYHALMMQAGMPIDIYPDRPNNFNLLHSSDYIEKIPRLLAGATSDVLTLNFGGSEAVSVEQWCEYIGELTGLKPVFNETDSALAGLPIDLRAMHDAIGETKTDWRTGIKCMMESMLPDMLKS